MRATPPGEENRAAGPSPSADPGTPAWPANVVVAPDGNRRRTVWFPVSATYRLVAPSKVIPAGEEKRTFPGPETLSAEPGVPGLPASGGTPAPALLRRVGRRPVSLT